MTAPLRAVLAPPVTTGKVVWPVDHQKPEERLDPYQHLGQHRISIRDELEKAEDLLRSHGYQVIPRVK